MMMGACRAARQDSTKLSKMNGYSSYCRPLLSTKVFRTIHANMNAPKAEMNFQLPPKLAILSESASPNVIFFSNASLIFWDRNSSSFRLASTSSSKTVISPRSSSTSF